MKPPAFLEGTFLWDRLGYTYAAPPPKDLLTQEALRSENPWLALASALEHAKHGIHDAVSILRKWMVVDSPPLAIRAGIALIADAGTDDTLNVLHELALDDHDFLRLEACWGIRTAGHLRLVRSMLEAWARAQRPSDRETISSGLSSLLEEAPGPIASSEEFSELEYEQLVRARVDQLVREFGTDRVALWRGRKYGVLSLARMMYSLVRKSHSDPEDLRVWFVTLRHRFEAYTGIDCSSFYRDREFQPLTAAVFLDDFLAVTPETQYADDVRYFFGHPIPASST